MIFTSFDDKYDNIAINAPELPEGLIYKSIMRILDAARFEEHW